MSKVRVRPAEVVLGFVEPGAQAEADRLLSDDPLFGAEVERLRGTVATLEELGHTAWRPEPPPPLESDRAMTLRTPRRRPRWVLAAAGAATAAAVAAVAVVLAGGSSPQPAAEAIALHALHGVPGRATITVRGNEAELSGTGMPPSGPHDYYEAWLGDRKGRMVSMGTFRVARDGTVDAHMPIAVDLSHYDLVDVSLEPDDGNPAHSNTSVMRARI